MQATFLCAQKLVAALRDASEVEQKLAAGLRDASEVKQKLVALLREGFVGDFIANSSMKPLKNVKIL